MAITIDYLNKIIEVPKSYLTLVSGSTYSLDIDAFRLDLKDLEDDEEGIAHLDTHEHTAPKTLAGIQYARFIEFINGYTIEFEDGQYNVDASVANSNLMDVLVDNQVSVRTNNSAGLIVTSGGGALTQEEHDQLMALPLIGKILALLGD